MLVLGLRAVHSQIRDLKLNFSLFKLVQLRNSANSATTHNYMSVIPTKKKKEKKPKPFGFGFMELRDNYGLDPAESGLLIILHKRLGALLDARPPKYNTNPVPISYEDLKAIHDLLLDQVFNLKVPENNTWGMDNENDPARQISTIDQCRWAYLTGLITQGEFESSRAFMRMA